MVAPFDEEAAVADSPAPPANEPARQREFATLYRSTLAPLRRYLARLLGNTTDAQDVAHDAYMRVYPALDKQAAERPAALLYVTARRLAINQLKRRSVSPFTRETTSLETAASTAPDVAIQVMARQELTLLEHALEELPPGCRAVLLLRKVEFLSHREIADRLGIAVSTVEKQHARALRLLRAALSTELTRDHLPPTGNARERAKT